MPNDGPMRHYCQQAGAHIGWMEEFAPIWRTNVFKCNLRKRPVTRGDCTGCKNREKPAGGKADGD